MEGVRVKNVTLLTCWNNGQWEVEYGFKNADLEALFEQMEQRGRFDMFHPFRKIRWCYSVEH